MLRRNIQGLTMPNGELRVFRDKEATVATKTDTTQSSPFGAVHNVFANFDPAATWQQALAGATDRAHAWANECALIEAQMYARTRAALDAWHQLALDTIAYSEQLTAQTRKAMFETMRGYGGTAGGGGAGSSSGSASGGGSSATGSGATGSRATGSGANGGAGV